MKKAERASCRKQEHLGGCLLKAIVPHTYANDARSANTLCTYLRYLDYEPICFVRV